MSERERVYCDVRGFVVDTSSHGSPGNTDPTASCYAYHITESGNFGTGPFSIQMGLALNQGLNIIIEPVHTI